MKIINASYKIINESSITKKIEMIARVCYKSEDKICEGTDVKMLNSLIQKQHTAMLEHGDIVLEVDVDTYKSLYDVVTAMETKLSLGNNRRCYLRFTQVNFSNDDSLLRCIVSGNIRAWMDALDVITQYGWVMSYELYSALINAFPLFIGRYKYDNEHSDTHFCNTITDFIKLLDEERMVHETISVLFTVDRGVTHEMVRHRDCSFAQESTRYCNYNLGKYGSEITVIEPCFFTGEGNEDKYNAWVSAMEDAETHYFDLMNMKVPAQQARNVLPTSVKADIVMTTNLREWKHILNLRACDSTGPAHPQMKEVMIPLLKELRAGTYNFAFGDMIAADEVHN